MSKQYYKIILYSLYIGIIVCAAYLLWWHFSITAKDKSDLAPRYYDATIVNQNTEFYSSPLNHNKPYEIPYLRIKNIGFKADSDFLYLRFQLGGTLPEENALPKYDGDQIEQVKYYMSLDENFFDLQGNKNPSGSDAELTMSFFGEGEFEAGNKIRVSGELLKGGPGHDYFVVRYPYQQLLINQNSEFIVFTAKAEVITARHPEGAGVHEFRNSTLAATRNDKSQILLDLSLKDLIY